MFTLLLTKKVRGKSRFLVQNSTCVNFQYGFEIAVLEPVLSHSEKSCIASYQRQFSTNIKIKANKTGFNHISFHFNIRRNL